MAKTRPYQTHYADGTVGHSTTALRASIAAVKRVLDGSSKHAQVVCPRQRIVLSAEKGRRDVHIYIEHPKELK